MVQEAINAVKEAEEQAEAKLEETRAQCDKLLADAKEEALAVQEKARAEAEKKAASAMEQAKCKGQEVLDESLGMAEKEIEALKMLACKKEEKAVETVISELV